MLTTPWALLALIAIPIVFGIYFFRTRSRRREVSSLFLWVDQSQARQGGRRLQRLQLPLLIFLELLVLILLAIAAARPMIRIESSGRPTVIVLDSSYSMQAGTDKDNVRQRAVDDLHKMFASQIGFPVQFILAGAKPQVVSGRAKNVSEAVSILDSWTCEAPTAAIDAAVSLAANISTPGTKVLVVTDHPPKEEIPEGKLLWKAFGRPLDNLAVVHASRVFQGEKDRLLLEIANFSDKPGPLRLNVIDPKRNTVIYRAEREVAPMETFRIRTGLPENIREIEIRLADDPLTVDNRLTLLPPSRRPVRVRLGDLPAELFSKVRKAVESSGIATVVDERPDLVFGSLSDSERSTGVWSVRFITEPDAEKLKSFVGPFVVDRQHPLATGLSLDGIVWSASTEFELDGISLVSAGTVPLLTEQIRRGGARTLNIQLNDRLSTLTGSPSWPILIWNILRFRQDQTVGVSTANLKLGAEAQFIAAEEDHSMELTPPHGEKKTIPISGGSATIAADQVGVYRIKTLSGEYSFAVGALSAEESDLRNADSGTFGNWLDEETIRSDYQSVAWSLLLAALALLSLHHWLVSRQSNV